ncbi:hypothetical protein EDB86DRAFT_2831263 [Lactarius hatsudake]|nr:hypothetical protein EDB86DRAFT_2831263 [Lactarius hatsudake]
MNMGRERQTHDKTIGGTFSSVFWCAPVQSESSEPFVLLSLRTLGHVRVNWGAVRLSGTTMLTLGIVNACLLPRLDHESHLPLHHWHYGKDCCDYPRITSYTTSLVGTAINASPGPEKISCSVSDQAHTKPTEGETGEFEHAWEDEIVRDEEEGAGMEVDYGVMPPIVESEEKPQAPNVFIPGVHTLGKDEIPEPGDSVYSTLCGTR